VRVLLAAAELSPLARTGGLGEAIAGLAGALQRADVDTTVVLPRYRHLNDLGEPHPGVGPARAIYRHDHDGLSVLLVDDPEAFDRPGIYGPEPGSGYEDQWFRFGRFSAVVREMSADYDLVHLNDSHTAPAALQSPVPSVLTIHNAAYAIHGPLDAVAKLLGAGPEHVTLGGPLEWFGSANYLKAGIDQAHRVTTVSPTFARQLADDPSISNGLDGVVRNRIDPIIGILNGIGLLDPYIGTLVDEGFRLVLVGNGDLDDLVDTWARRHPTAVWHAPYEEPLARLTSAGADAYLMPSRYEPCGLGQMYAMRYGAPPVVRLTGGLADSVIDLDERPADATGFGFRTFSPESLIKTIRRAMRVFRKSRADWRRLQRNGMAADFSWDRAAARYLEVYESVLG
jgi:starch synthase